MARGDVRIAVTLACEECKRRNYQSEKSKRNNPDRIEFRRAGKSGGGGSFNVARVDGVPVTFNFSTNAGLPVDQGLGPSQLRCYLERGTCDTATMRQFAAVLRAELGWEPAGGRDAPTRPGGPAARHRPRRRRSRRRGGRS